jgi:acyl-CoA dehydrogenase family member 9
MPGNQFLVDLYQGTWNAELYSCPPAPVDDLKVADITHKYRQIVKEFPAAVIEELGRIPDELRHQLAQGGFFGLTIPEAYGGIGLNTREYLRVVEAIAGADLSVALVSLAHLSIGVKGVVLFGNDVQKAKYLPSAATGETIFAYALTEPLIGSDAKHITTSARLSEDGRHYLLNGQKTYITNANYAGAMTVFAQLDPARPGYMGAFVVETGWEGITIGKDMPKMGLKASSTAAVQFRNVRVPIENLLGRPGDGFRIAMTVLNYGRLGLGAASVGLMEQSLTDMIQRASTRVQFGVPIKSFPLIQEKIVKARVHGTVAAAMNAFAAKLLDQHPLADLAVETSHCKLFGTTRAWDTLYDAFQLAGGSAYLTTQPYEKRLRDFRVATVFEGTTEIHSIYPPLFVLRKIMRRFDDPTQGLFDQLRFFGAGLFGGVDWPLRCHHRIARQAAGLARRHAAAIKRMLFAGLLLFGRKVTHREFFLRRVTRLSLYVYGTLALLARLEEDRRDGPNPDTLLALQYFTEEARQAGKANRSILATKLDSLTHRVFQSLEQE